MVFLSILVLNHSFLTHIADCSMFACKKCFIRYWSVIETEMKNEVNLNCGLSIDVKQ